MTSPSHPYPSIFRRYRSEEDIRRSVFIETIEALREWSERPGEPEPYLLCLDGDRFREITISEIFALMSGATISFPVFSKANSAIRANLKHTRRWPLSFSVKLIGSSVKLPTRLLAARATQRGRLSPRPLRRRTGPNRRATLALSGVSRSPAHV